MSTEVIEVQAEEVGLNKRESKEFVDIFFEEIRCALENNR